jgi:hypothetical protein
MVSSGGKSSHGAVLIALGAIFAVSACSVGGYCLYKHTRPEDGLRPYGTMEEVSHDPESGVVEMAPAGGSAAAR